MPKIADIQKIVKKYHPVGLSLSFTKSFGSGFDKAFAIFYKSHIAPSTAQSRNQNLSPQQQLELIKILIAASRNEQHLKVSQMYKDLRSVFPINVISFELILDHLTPRLADIFIKKKFTIDIYHILVLREINLSPDDEFFQQDQKILDKFMLAIKILDVNYRLNERIFDCLRTHKDMLIILDIINNHKHLPSKIDYLFNSNYSHLIPILQEYDSPYIGGIICELTWIQRATPENIAIAHRACESAGAPLSLGYAGQYWDEVIAKDSHHNVLQCFIHLEEGGFLNTLSVKLTMQHPNPAELRHALKFACNKVHKDPIDIDTILELSEPITYMQAIMEIKKVTPTIREMLLRCHDRVLMVRFIKKNKSQLEDIFKYFEAFKDLTRPQELLDAINYLQKAGIVPNNIILKLLIKCNEPLILTKAMRYLHNRDLLDHYLKEVSSADNLIAKADEITAASSKDKVFIDAFFASSPKTKDEHKGNISTQRKQLS